MTILYRPVGPEELHLVFAARMRAFPPRLLDQPIFYPVTNEAYARQIAEQWNTKSGSLAGFVTRFSVADAYAANFERRVVGAREHEELWVPAEELAEFNRYIEHPIEVIGAYFGDGFDDRVRTQFVALARMAGSNGTDFTREVAASAPAVFLGFFLWEQTDFTDEGFDLAARDRVLAALRATWASGAHVEVPLGIVRP